MLYTTLHGNRVIYPCPLSISIIGLFHVTVLNEIEERRQFLADMAALGQEKQYINIINIEISQVKMNMCDNPEAAVRMVSKTYNKTKYDASVWHRLNLKTVQRQYIQFYLISSIYYEYLAQFTFRIAQDAVRQINDVNRPLK